MQYSDVFCFFYLWFFCYIWFLFLCCFGFAFSPSEFICVFLEQLLGEVLLNGDAILDDCIPKDKV